MAVVLCHYDGIFFYGISFICVSRFICYGIIKYDDREGVLICYLKFLWGFYYILSKDI